MPEQVVEEDLAGEQEVVEAEEVDLGLLQQVAVVRILPEEDRRIPVPGHSNIWAMACSMVHTTDNSMACSMACNKILPTVREDDHNEPSGR